jgi:NADPH:quinone reductase-like Zn-dependent oxidoreductase
MTGMVKVVRFHEAGGPKVLRIEDLRPSQPGPGEVRLRVEAIGPNRAEALFRSGQYLEPAKYPARIGYKAAGIIDAVGSGVDASQPGEAVSDEGLERARSLFQEMFASSPASPEP